MQYWQKIGLGIGIIGTLFLTYGGLRQPQWMFRVGSLLKPGALFFVDTEQPVIALTIDDGPYVETTDAILQVLERHGVTATFFMLSDDLPEHDATIRRLVASGHELGNHMTEDEASISLSSNEFKDKFLRADGALSGYGPVSWFRPGMGWYNDAMVNVIAGEDYQLVLGSLFPYDPHVPSVRFAEWFVLTNLDPGDILVLHDGPKNRGERTVDLLGRLLPKIKARGYRIVTLTELKSYGE